MSTCAFSIDQLMELAGLSVSQAGKVVVLDQAKGCVTGTNIPTTKYSGSIPLRRVLGFWLPVALGITVGGDGLVAARHLFHYGYSPTIFYPKRSKNELYQRLAKQLEDLRVPFVDDFRTALDSTDHVVDAIFGFSFSGEVREPFPAVIQALADAKVPVTSVDAPSSWDIENGPPNSGLGSNFMPATLVSLTAPKPLVKHFTGRHFVGGRFVSPMIAKKYDFEVPEYKGLDQVVEVAADGHRL
ncbi:unnamed protein product [Clonostachys rhizophaga]|uniref:NAD(P)H-hydrate epimerase n=1 Tax=Clonostachys rhizophaga TaxID=160324 RepID=A0A9N9VGU8_9HYPO|nr:unnamed protein product [Clonostachys rhizophaga]